MYFRLLERCNALGWKNPFNFAVDELLVKLRLKTKDPLDTARNRLKQAGLLDFKNGQGRGHATTYWLAPAEEENPVEKDKKNAPFSPAFSSPFSPAFSPPQKPLVHKTKLNQTKENLTTLSGAALAAESEQQVSELVREQEMEDAPAQAGSTCSEDQQEPGLMPVEPPGKKEKATSSAPLPLAERWPELVAQLSEEDRATWQRFVEWELENPVPKLFQMKDPLSPAQWVKLKRKYSEAPQLLASVMRDMQNSTILLKKYDSARATIESWMRIRQK